MIAGGMHRVAWFGGVVLLLLGFGAAYGLANPLATAKGCPPGQAKANGQGNEKGMGNGHEKQCVPAVSTEVVTLALTGTQPTVTVEGGSSSTATTVTVDAQSETVAAGTGSTVVTVAPQATETVTLPVETVTIPATTSAAAATTVTLAATTQALPAETVVRPAQPVPLPAVTTVLTAPASGTVATVTAPSATVPELLRRVGLTRHRVLRAVFVSRGRRSSVGSRHVALAGSLVSDPLVCHGDGLEPRVDTEDT